MTSDYYDPAREGGFSFRDPGVGIVWPSDIELTPSDRDSRAPTLAEIKSTLPFSLEGSP